MKETNVFHLHATLRSKSLSAALSGVCARAAVICVAALTLGGCNISGPAAESDAAAKPQVALRVVAGLVGESILFQNHSNEQLENIVIAIKDENTLAEFSHNISRVAPNSTTTFFARVFVSGQGQKLNPGNLKIDSITVTADTPRGPGRWAGSYRPNPGASIGGSR